MNANNLGRLAMCVVLALGGVCAGQDDSGVLRGPKVPDGVSRTLVHQGMTGGFQRVEGRPEAAAVLLLGLDADRQRVVESIVQQHAFNVAMLLVDEIDTVKEMSDAVIAEDRERSQELLAGLWSKADPEHRRDLLMPALSKVLTADESAQATRLLDEYWDAWISWELRGARQFEGDALAEARKKTQERLAFSLFQQEVREGYEVTLQRYRQAMDAMYEAVQPTDEQRGAMRNVVIEHIRATRLEATPDQRRAAMHEIYQLLDDERKELLFDYLLRQVVRD